MARLLIDHGHGAAINSPYAETTKFLELAIGKLCSDDRFGIGAFGHNQIYSTLPVATVCATLGMGIGFLLSADLPDWALELIYYAGELCVRRLKLVMIIIPASLASDMNDESIYNFNILGITYMYF